MKQIAIDVKEFAIQVPYTGSIESGSGFGIRETTALGQKIHKAVQHSRKEQYAQYKAEVKISHKFTFDGYCITVNGRIDGLFESVANQAALVAEPSGGCADSQVSLLDDPEAILTAHPNANALKTRAANALKTRAANALSVREEFAEQSALTIPGLHTERVTAHLRGCRLVDAPHIEEIKSALSAARLAQDIADPWHPYCLQLNTYAYLYWKQTGQMPTASLHLVSLANRNKRDVDVVLNVAKYEQWLSRRLKHLVEEATRQEKLFHKRKRMSEKLELPFEQARCGQQELIQQIEEGFSRKKTILVQAPTGLGKTMSVMLPSLKEALSRGQKLIYLTPKNSVHLVAEEAVKQLRQKKMQVKSLTLTAKAKLCLKSEQVCDPNVCEYAKDYYDKVEHHNLVEKASKAQHMSPQLFTDYGKQYTVCPFELSIDCIDRADIVICDYNHAFAPVSLAGRLTAPVHKKKEKPNIVIDEAHNLHNRATGYFSAALSTKQLMGLRSQLKQTEFETRAILDSCVQLIQELATKQSVPEARAYVTPEPFIKIRDDLGKLILDTFSGEIRSEEAKPVMELSWMLNEFCNALSYTDAEQIYTCLKRLDDVTIKAICCDASKYLRQQYTQFQNVVAFSATLKPFQYYLTLSGFDTDTVELIEARSPFPVENRKVLVIPQVSTKYRDRASNYGKICEAVSRIASLKSANYILFFPSFDFLEQIASRLNVPNYTKLIQRRGISQSEVGACLDQLRSSTGYLLLAVQGGVFSEGLDFAGDMAAGAFIIGPGLPTFDLERELLREYYERVYGSGFEYAYSYPAMTKVIQSAGRILRSETDRGLIVLFDRRFLADSYVQAMPADWYVKSPMELVSNSICNDINLFWNSGNNALA